MERRRSDDRPWCVSQCGLFRRFLGGVRYAILGCFGSIDRNVDGTQGREVLKLREGTPVNIWDLFICVCDVTTQQFDRHPKAFGSAKRCVSVVRVGWLVGFGTSSSFV